MVLYSNAIDSSSVFYRGEDRKIGSDILFEDGVSKDIRDVNCIKEKGEGGYKIDDKNTMEFDKSVKTIVVFPVLLVDGEILREGTDGNPNPDREERRIFRYWRGNPWRYTSNFLDKDVLISVAKTQISPGSSIKVTIPTPKKNCPKYAEFTLPVIDHGRFKVGGGDEKGYRIDYHGRGSENILYKNESVRGITFFTKRKGERVDEEEEVILSLVLNTFTSHGNPKVFGITPVLNDERGQSTCFEVKVGEGTGGGVCLDSVEQQNSCVDRGLDKGSEHYEESVLSTVKGLLTSHVVGKEEREENPIKLPDDSEYDYQANYYFTVSGYDTRWDTSTLGDLVDLASLQGNKGRILLKSSSDGVKVSVQDTAIKITRPEGYLVRILYKKDVGSFCVIPHVSVNLPGKGGLNITEQVALNSHCFEIQDEGKQIIELQSFGVS